MKHLNSAQMFAVKLGITQGLKFTPFEVCFPGLYALTITGYGAGLWNLGVILGSGVAAVPVIIGVIWWQWDDWNESTVRTCNDPWHFEPITFFNETGFNDKNNGNSN
jgi:hypothetical protein